MTKQSAVTNFLKNKSIAVVGVSRDKKKFGYIAYKNLKDKGYKVSPVNPNVEAVDSDKCYPNLSSIKENIEGVLLVVPPQQSEKVVREAHDLGIKSVWFQQGSSSDEAIKFCEGNDMSVVSGECIMMFTEPVESFHKFHRWIWKLFGKLPR
ncbi:MAG: CoA-binding protein [Ignavibacteriales bacterium]|nr:CoA-binding protein [Ignavibacteriales bacterium]